MKLTKAERLLEKELIKRTKGMNPTEAVAYIIKFSVNFIVWKEIKEIIKGENNKGVKNNGMDM